MQVIHHSGQKVVVQILIGRWSPWKLPLHHWYQLAANLVNLVSSKEIGYLQGLLRIKGIRLQSNRGLV